MNESFGFSCFNADRAAGGKLRSKTHIRSPAANRLACVEALAAVKFTFVGFVTNGENIDY
jgi:hypothetical protein